MKKERYFSRIDALKNATKSKCDALIVDYPVDLFYLTGIHLSLGHLLIADEVTLFVDGRYTEMCQRLSPFPVLPLKESLSPTHYRGIKKLGFDAKTISYAAYQKFTEALKKITLVPLNAPVLHVRAIKDAEEVNKLREAAILGSRGYDFVLTLLEEGVKESELAAALEIFWRKSGGSAVAFDPIIAFGENSSMPHYRAGERALRKGDVVLIDIGVTLDNYHSDMTRTVFFGTPDAKLEKVHKVVCEAQQAALKLCKPGTKIGEIDTAARDYIAEKGFGSYFNHGLGHGVGLEVHELPVVKNIPHCRNIKLAKGMVITIEPGIYLPGIGGVRIEDTIVITDRGYENLTDRPTSSKWRKNV